MNRRTLLFMPGNNPGMLINGDVLGADTVIFDLEDAVALDEKDAARLLVRNALNTLEFTESEIAVRINPIDSPYWEADLDEIVPAQPDAIVIPKASTEAVPLVEGRILELKKKHGISKQIVTLLLVESAMGILDIQNICKSSTLFDGLLLGAEDLSSDMGIKRTKGSGEIQYARNVLATAAHAYKVDGIDTPYTDVEDMEGLVEDTRYAKSIGLNGRLLINPRQVDAVHEVLSPTEEEIEEAQAILYEAEQAREKGLGVFSYRGKMVDLPVIKRAEQTMESAKKWGLLR